MFERGIRDTHPMVGLISIPQPFQDADGLLVIGRFDDDLLETAFQCRVFLDVFPILIERRGPDALDFPTAQRRLEHIGGVDGAFRAARAD